MTPAGPREAPYRFPMERSNERAFPPDYEGPIDVFDIDKTYLESEFETAADLVRTALARAIDRRTRPGLATLLRALRRGPRPDDPLARRTPLYFVSATPPQLRPVIVRKMLRDEVEWDGLAFKDHLALIRAGRFREMRRHAAYKLTALLEYRIEWPAGAREWLYGDDAESDAQIYSLYAGIRGGRLEGAALEAALAAANVGARDVRAIRELAERAAPFRATPVEAIYIFRVAAAPRLDLGDFPLATPVLDAAACAADLAARGRIPGVAVEEIAREMRA